MGFATALSIDRNRGAVRRTVTTNHLQLAFGIERQQASRDINAYLSEYAQANLIYNRQLKGYKPNKGFSPKFTRGIADE
jgi:predicted DNA-binding transcriptional regulator YafY